MDDKENSSELENLGPECQDLTCSSCHKSITTRVVTKSTRKSRIFTIFKCLCCCWLCCQSEDSMDFFKEKRHYCPECNAFLGTHR